MVKKEDNKKIYLSILNQGWIAADLAIKLPRWIHECPYPVTFEQSSSRPIEHNRNSIVQRFLETNCTHLIQIDNDTVPLKNPLKLVDVDVDVIACAVPIYQEGIIYFNAFELEQYPEPTYKPIRYINDSKKDVLQEVDAFGTGCFMCSRKVYETIKYPFKRLYDSDGLEILGSDIYFSQRVKKAGFKLFTHFGFKAKHIKDVNLLSL